jgi:hypothetical protein
VHRAIQMLRHTVTARAAAIATYTYSSRNRAQRTT